MSTLTYTNEKIYPYWLFFYDEDTKGITWREGNKFVDKIGPDKRKELEDSFFGIYNELKEKDNA